MGTALIRKTKILLAKMKQLFRFSAQQGIILLSFILAIGFLLIILSGALYGNWMPILIAAIFVLAPAPNAICSRCSGAVDFGHFLTAIFVVTGFALPLVLAHASVLHPIAAYMSIAGGALVYTTIIVYSRFFSAANDTF